MKNKFVFGRHMSISFGLANAVRLGHDLHCTIIQIFLGNPERILNKTRSQQELLQLRDSLTKYDMKLVIHGSYTVNLCNDVGSVKFVNSVKSIVQDLNASSIIGTNVLGVIMHMGKNVNHLPILSAMKNYVYGIKNILSLTVDSILILETGASQGNEIASRIEGDYGLSKVYEELNSNEKKRVKFCIDTCHIWASGYDISTVDKVKEFISLFDKLIGIDKIACIHLNDSERPLGSKVDRHADLGYGYIPLEGLSAFAKFCYQNNIPMILETPLDAINPKTNKPIDIEDELRIAYQML
jgi:deoxyribonuclease-4